MSQQPKPTRCPYPSCGSTYVTTTATTKPSEGAWVECETCGARGPKSRVTVNSQGTLDLAVAEAVKLWNQIHH